MPDSNGSPKLTDSEQLTALQMFPIVLSSCLATLIEWYDFFIFGTLAPTLSSKFFKTGTEAGDMIAFLATFAAGFIFRPLGALIFGWMGDRYGRKITFMTCLMIMGVSTVGIGCLPTLDDVGLSAGIVLVAFRIAQGIALGGEYGGSATFIAEHSPPKHRGFYVSFLSLTGTAGFMFSLIVILSLRIPLGEEKFLDYGWRIPFLISALLILISYTIRSNLGESPLFKKARDEGTLSKNIFADSFTKKRNLYYICLAIFGGVMGIACQSSIAHFYSFTFMQVSLRMPMVTTYILSGTALLASLPMFLVAGMLSDKFGRKTVMLSGMVLATLSYYPCFMALVHFSKYEKPYEQLTLNPQYSPVSMILILWYLSVIFAISSAPLAAWLVELFPTNIRYTCLSAAYHIGSALFGGKTPVFAAVISSYTSHTLAGLYYPLTVMAICSLISFSLVKETNHYNI